MSATLKINTLNSLIDIEELYEHAPCGYFSFLPSGKIIKMNQTLLDWLGYEEDEVVQKKRFTDLIAKGGAIYYEMFHLPMLKMQKQVNEINYNLIRKNSTNFPALLNAKAKKDSKGNLLAINATVYDITERKKYERELMRIKNQADAEKKRFKFLADLIPDMLFTANTEGELDYLNQRFRTYLSLGEKANTADILINIHPADRNNFLRVWLKALKSGSDVKLEVRLQNQQKIYQWHLIQAIPYRDESREISKWFGSCTNIDEQIEDRNKSYRLIDIARTKFKTPLASLKAYNQLLLRANSEKTKILIEKSSATLGNLQLLISGLDDISQISKGEFKINPVLTSLNDIVQASINVVNSNYPTHQIIKEYDENEHIFVRVDRHRVLQVLITLLGNAIKYSPYVSKVILRLIKSSDLKSVEIQVKDLGVGIPEDRITRVFEEHSSEHTDKDLGGNLFVAQNIMKLHNSTISVKSTINLGSTFYFFLPVESIEKKSSEVEISW